LRSVDDAGRIRAVPQPSLTGKSRGARWAYRTVSWAPILILFAVLAAIRVDASYDVTMSLVVIGFFAVVIDVIVFFGALDRNA
jgi:hypothetical protein